ncbi:type II toxin-antitoxin system HicB family antitoxin [Desulfosarcina ovata]|uniref:HicB family protein n=1 Tax=Desulfosarcina ovata subsp. ovata TaxID=2752305 RepID=A0A5K8A3J2_9BACT|nr:type II toxin-antitoxin system HicB family antitoxin [Desulfosarcina ovata]BBO87031.1 HicB family protein [Desulfosarcina ovata subsp. ovata]
MSNYIAVVHKNSSSDYGVSFPDFPGCITGDKSIDTVKDLSSEALSGHIQTMREFGEKIPNPTKLDDIVADQDYSDAIAFFVVSAPEVKSKTVRVNITLPENILHQIDVTAKKRGMSRSSFLTHAAQNVMHS